MCAETINFILGDRPLKFFSRDFPHTSHHISDQFTMLLDDVRLRMYCLLFYSQKIICGRTVIRKTLIKDIRERGRERRRKKQQQQCERREKEVVRNVCARLHFCFFITPEPGASYSSIYRRFLVLFSESINYIRHGSPSNVDWRYTHHSMPWAPAIFFSDNSLNILMESKQIKRSSRGSVGPWSARCL